MKNKEYTDYKSGEKLPEFAVSGIKKFEKFLRAGNQEIEFEVISKRVCLEKHGFDFNWPGMYVKIDGDKHFVSLSDLKSFHGPQALGNMSNWTLYAFTDQENIDMLYAELRREANKPGGF